MGTMTTRELLPAPGTQYRTMRYHLYWSGVSVSNDTRLLSLCQATETFEANGGHSVSFHAEFAFYLRIDKSRQGRFCSGSAHP